ncbi:uncharacterized protein LOC142356878, partial [Convolutriloba macropyga]|uniref:uncharacterized protein LOC142356878 n=1 Tax=Convolutriloba macropyga TaxID=536237 RepID=UPI003F51C487
MFAGYSISGCRGRLGNQLGVVALGMQMHLRFGIRLLIDPFQYRILNDVFDMEQICKRDGSSFCMRIPKGCKVTTRKKDTLSFTREELWERGLSSYGELPSDLKGKKIELPLYPQFHPWIIEVFLSEFRKRMKFHDRVVSGATQIVNRARKEYNCFNPSSCVLVVVHMRMEDYPKALKTRPIETPELMTQTDYLPNAFNHAANVHHRALFLVVGHTSGDISNYFLRHEHEFKQYNVVQAWRLEEKSGLSKEVRL